MHTLSDLGDGKAQDLARLCEVAHVGRLGPEEAAIVGALLNLPPWAVDRIPTLDPGQAVWKVGPDYVDIVQTVISEDEAQLTDTSSRRRMAQQALAVEQDTAAPATDSDIYKGQDRDALVLPEQQQDNAADDGTWDWEMPPNVIDARHHDVLQAALAGRCNEAADLAAIGEREDIHAHGINSDQAISWLSTRARVADLCGSPDQAIQLRATVTRMGKDVEWFEQTKGDRSPQWHRGPEPTVPQPPIDDTQSVKSRRRTWPYTAAIAALAITAVGVWQSAADDKQDQERQAKAAGYKGVSATDLNIDGVETEARAKWSKDGESVVLSVWVDWEEDPKLVRIDSGDQTAQARTAPLEEGQIPMPIHLEVKVPIKDRYQAVRMTVAVGALHGSRTREPRAARLSSARTGLPSTQRPESSSSSITLDCFDPSGARSRQSAGTPIRRAVTGHPATRS
jgi:hypothetical protein